MREDVPTQDDGIDASAENPTLIVPGTSGGYEHVDIFGEPPVDPSTLEAYQAMIGGEQPQDVMVGETLIRPSTAGRQAYVSPQPSADVAPNYAAYNQMVNRPGFPPAQEGGTEQNPEVDISL